MTKILSFQRSEASKALKDATKKIDKIASKGIIHKKKASNKKQTKTIKENFKGMASKAAGVSRTKNTAPKRAIISESDNLVNRFQKLANIKISE